MTDTPSRFPDGVTVITDVAAGTLQAIWDRALFGVSPSITPEGLGNVVHEAMSRGCPMIGTRPGGHEDIIEDGDSGLLVPLADTAALADAMARLISDPELRRRLGRRALERASLFTPEHVFPQLERLYYETAGRRALGSRNGQNRRR